MKAVRRIMYSLLLVLVLGGCGSQKATSPVNGKLVKGPVAGARIDILAVDDRGQAIYPAVAQASTAADGSFSLPDLPGDTYLAISQGGVFQDESDVTGQRKIVLGTTEGFESIILPGVASVAITPYTQAMVNRIRSDSRVAGLSFKALIEPAREVFAAALGFDPLKTLPANPVAPDANSSEAEIAYAMLLGGFANAANSHAMAHDMAEPGFVFVQALIEDLGDGKLDGAANGQVIAVNGQALNPLSMQHEIERFANNNASVYRGHAAPQLQLGLLQKPIPVPGTTPPPSPQASPSPVPTPTPVASPTPASTATPAPTVNPTQAPASPTPVPTTSPTPVPTATPTPAPPTSTLKLPRYVGGRDTTALLHGGLRALEVVGTTAYVATDPGLAIVSVSDPTKPTVLSQSAIGSGQWSGLTHSNGLLYASTPFNGFVIYDIADQHNPIELGRLTSIQYPTSAVIDGSRAYIPTSFTGVQIVDVSSPSSPVILGEIPAVQNASGVAVNGNLAYVTDFSTGAGLRIFDVSNPSAPVLLGTASTSGSAGSIVLDAGHAYIGAGAGVHVFDISNPASPTLLRVDSQFSFAQVQDIVGTTLYVLDEQGPALFDVSDPSALRLVSHPTTTDNAYPEIIDGGRLVLAGSLGYLQTSLSHFKVLDLSNPGNVSVLGRLEQTGYSSGVTTDGALVYVANSSLGVQVFDISNPGVPVLRNNITQFGSPTNPVFSDGLLYFSVANRGIKIVDISGQAPQLIADLTAAHWRDWDKDGSLVYGESSDSLIIFDVTTPSSPIELSRTPLGSPGSLSEISASAGLVMVSTQTSVLVVDASNPQAPQQGGTIEDGNLVNDVELINNLGFVTARNGRLSLWDLSNPASPVQVGSVDLGGNPRGITISGTSAYVANSTTGVQLVDISDPTQPSLVGTVVTPGQPSAMLLSGCNGLVAAGTAQLQILNVCP